MLGAFLKLLEDDKLDPGTTALLLPTANGPCRFGQYCRLVRRILDEKGFHDVDVFSFTSADGYAGIGDQAGEMIRTAWRAVVTQDILMKLLLMTRPVRGQRRRHRQGLPGVHRPHGRDHLPAEGL